MKMSNDQKFGLHWEKWTLQELHNRGYSQARLVNNFFSDRDIMLGTMPIEVKAARGKKHWSGRCFRTRWQFDVSRGPKNTDHVLILVAIDHNEQPFPFVVPSWAISFQSNVHITSHPTAYAGRFHQYLDHWTMIETVKNTHDFYNGQQVIMLGTGDNAQLGNTWGQNSQKNKIQVSLSPIPII